MVHLGIINKVSCAQSVSIHIICNPGTSVLPHNATFLSQALCPCFTMLVIWVCHFLFSITTSWYADLVHHWTVITSCLQNDVHHAAWMHLVIECWMYNCRMIWLYLHSIYVALVCYRIWEVLQSLYHERILLNAEMCCELFLHKCHWDTFLDISFH